MADNTAIPGLEVNEVTVPTQYHLLPVDQRAQIALGTSKTEADLIALATKHTSITEIKDKAGREQAHGAAMELMRARTTIADVAKKARDDATKFSKAVIDEEKRLVAIVEPEEKRLKGLRDAWDEEQERIKRERAEAERKRILAISTQINEMKAFTQLAAQCRTSARIQELIGRLTAIEVTPEVFAEFTDDAAAVKSATLNQMGLTLKTKQDQEAEAQRLADERAEQERIRAEQAERQRQLDEQAAELERKLQELEAAQAATQKPAEALPVEPSTQSNTSPVNVAAIPAADAEILNQTAATPVPAAEPEKTTTATVVQLTGQIRNGGTVAVRPSDDEIVSVIAIHFNVHESKAIEWLLDLDIEAVASSLETEFA